MKEQHEVCSSLQITPREQENKEQRGALKGRRYLANISDRMA